MSVTRDDTSDYARLFLSDTPLLDTRAPIEFARGAFPTAKNIPLMSDDERAAVGTCYKHKGQVAAIELGHDLVSGQLREDRIAAWRAFAQQNPAGYLYCFRGGLRSQLVQQWLAEAGVYYPRVTGGYKAMRRYLLDALEASVEASEFWLVAGATGSGKTRFLHELMAAQGTRARAVDLEGLAHHRGSAFGRLLDEQPTQIDFENALSIALLRLAENAGPIVIEDEGHLIGRVALPDSLREKMAQAPLLVLDYPLEARVEQVLHDYVVDLGARYEARLPGIGLPTHRERLLEDLARTRKRLGTERHTQLAALMASAFEEQARSGDIAAHRLWISRLLAEYYDPMYAFQLSKRGGRRLCVGDRQTLGEFVVAASNNA